MLTKQLCWKTWYRSWVEDFKAHLSNSDIITNSETADGYDRAAIPSLCQQQQHYHQPKQSSPPADILSALAKLIVSSRLLEPLGLHRDEGPCMWNVCESFRRRVRRPTSQGGLLLLVALLTGRRRQGEHDIMPKLFLPTRANSCNTHTRTHHTNIH